MSVVLWRLSTAFVKRDELTGRDVAAWTCILLVQVALFAVSVRKMDRFRVSGRLRAVVAYLLLPVGLALVAVLARVVTVPSRLRLGKRKA